MSDSEEMKARVDWRSLLAKRMAAILLLSGERYRVLAQLPC